MRFYVEVSSIGSGAPAARHCVEAEQWQGALSDVRSQRGDTTPFGNFSIELLDDGYRAIDPVSRTRYVVLKAPNDAELTTFQGVDQEKTPAIVTRDASTSSTREVKTATPSSGGRDIPEPRTSNRGRPSRRGRGRSPSIPDDPVPPAKPLVAPVVIAPVVAAPVVAAPVVAAPVVAAPVVAAPAAPAVQSAPPQVPPSEPARPMQAFTAFERMTGGSAVDLPSHVSATADVPTQILPGFKVISRRNEDPTPASPLTYRELAIAVDPETALEDAEAIARAQCEVLQNAISGAPKGKFIQLAVFDHTFSGKPKGPPLVVLSFKDWRDSVPDIRFPDRDGPSSRVPAALMGGQSDRPPTRSMPPVGFADGPATVKRDVALGGTQKMAAVDVAPPTVSDPSSVGSRPTVAVDMPLPSQARPSAEPPVPESERIVPSKVISIEGSSEAMAPATAAPAVVAPVPTPPSAPSRPVVPRAPESAQPERRVPEPSPSSLRRGAAEMAEDEPTIVHPQDEELPASIKPKKPSKPAPADAAPPPAAPAAPPPVEAAPAAPPPAEAAPAPAAPPAAPSGPVLGSAPPAAPPPKAELATEPLTERIPSVPPPAPLPAEMRAAVPPPAPTQRMASVPPPAQTASNPPPGVSQPPPGSSQPPASGPTSMRRRNSSIMPAVSVPPPVTTSLAPPSTLLVRAPKGPRRHGDDLIGDLFEACSDLGFIVEPLEGSEFVVDLILEMMQAKLVLISFFDINSREFVVVRQGAAAGHADELPNVVLYRVSEYTPLVARTMRSPSATLFKDDDIDNVVEDARWMALGVAPSQFLCAPVKAEGRFLGLIEVADTMDETPFSEGDGNALTYIAQQFGEFLAQREINLGVEHVSKPRLADLRRR